MIDYFCSNSLDLNHFMGLESLASIHQNGLSQIWEPFLQGNLNTPLSYLHFNEEKKNIDLKCELKVQV